MDSPAAGKDVIRSENGVGSDHKKKKIRED
jgi:hypothetical protein